MHYPWILKADKTFKFVISAQFLFGLVIGFNTENFNLALFLGALIAALPLLFLFQKPGEVITRHIVAVGIQLATALHIQMAQGLTEIHFEIFSLLAILIFYRDWKVILTSVVVVAIHHILFFILQLQNVGFYVFEQGDVFFYILVIHALFAVIEGAILMYIAKDSHDEGVSSLEIKHSIKTIMADEERFNLTTPLRTDLADLKQYNRLITSFRQLLEKTRATSDSAYQTTEQAVRISNEIHEFSQQNAEQVASIAQAVVEMAAANAEISNHAEDVSNSAGSAQSSTLAIQSVIEQSHSTVFKLKEVITSTAESIQNLSAKCNRIEEVMSSITAISDQTNLLALNAAIESARAGEHGRGFAVVADEVRQLATKTRENAEGISEVVKSLIEDASISVNQMDNCISEVDVAVQQSSQMSESADRVVQNIQMVADNIISVASATTEQAEVSDSISVSTQEMQDMSVMLAENITQTRTEMKNLESQIIELNNELKKFDV